MKLTNASVTGLFGTYDHSIELDPEGLTFIHSTNGMGKSVFLKLIQNLLKGQLDYLERIPFDRMDLGFADGSRIIAEKDEGLRIQMQKNGLEETVGPYELQGLLEPMYISPERLTVKRSDGSLMYAIDVYSEELENRFNIAKEETAVDVFGTDPGEDMADDEIEAALSELQCKTEFMCSAGLRMTLPVSMRMNPTRYDISKNHENYLKLVRAVSAYVDGCHQFAESVVVFLDIINSFFVNKRITMSNGITHVTMSNGDAVPLDTLSSGEKHILIIFYRILFQAQPGSLVIIDEPEISIHVSWQQKMGHTLLDICRLRDLQMLVATHSPQIIHDMWDRANELGGERA